MSFIGGEGELMGCFHKTTSCYLANFSQVARGETLKGMLKVPSFEAKN